MGGARCVERREERGGGQGGGSFSADTQMTLLQCAIIKLQRHEARRRVPSYKLMLTKMARSSMPVYGKRYYYTTSCTA